MTTPTRTDETRIRRAMLTFLLVAGVCFASFVALKTNSSSLQALVLLAPFLIFLFDKPSTLLLIMVFSSVAALRVPGMPGELKIEHIIRAIFLVWGVVITALHKSPRKKSDPAAVFLLLFALNLILTAAVRGTGLAILGGQQQGGMSYVYLLLAFLFYFPAKKVNFDAREVRILFFGSIFCAAIPALVQLCIVFLGEKALFLTNFVDVSLRQITQAAMAQDATKARFGSLGGVAFGLMTIALVMPSLRKRFLSRWGILFATFILQLLSGFRGRIVGLTVIVFMWILYEATDRKRTFFLLLTLGILGWGAVLTLLPVLPPTMQRALSFLPLAETRISDPLVLHSAAGSLDFRLEIWRLAWANAPKYLFIGRGLSIGVEGWAWLSAEWYRTPEFFYHAHAYHSGPLGLLLDTGIFGLVCAIGFMVSVCVKGWRGVREYCSGHDDLISRYYVFLVISFSYQTVSYFLIFGDIRETIPKLVVQAVLIEICRKQIVNNVQQSV